MLKNKNILKNEIKYKWKILLVSKLWKSERSAFLKFFHAFLKFDLPKARFLNFLQNSTLSLIGPFLIIGVCVYIFQCLRVKVLSLLGRRKQKRQSLTLWKNIYTNICIAHRIQQPIPKFWSCKCLRLGPGYYLEVKRRHLY